MITHQIQSIARWSMVRSTHNMGTPEEMASCSEHLIQRILACTISSQKTPQTKLKNQKPKSEFQKWCLTFWHQEICISSPSKPTKHWAWHAWMRRFHYICRIKVKICYQLVEGGVTSKVPFEKGHIIKFYKNQVHDIGIRIIYPCLIIF